MFVAWAPTGARRLLASLVGFLFFFSSEASTGSGEGPGGPRLGLAALADYRGAPSPIIWDSGQRATGFSVKLC